MSALEFGRRRRTGERVVHALLVSCAAVTVATTVGIVGVLLHQAVEFFREVPLGDFATGGVWTPHFADPSYGVLPLVTGSFLVAVIAGMVALPTGLLSAVFLSEYAPGRVRAVVKPMLEILAGIPTVVYGYVALTLVTPALQVVLPDIRLFNALSAGLVVGVMILPMVISLSEDALRTVPRGLREAAFGLGATRFETSMRVVVPAAASGIAASFILALARAVGETMVVTIAAGNLANLTLDPFESVQTMTSFIAQVSLGDTPRGTLIYHSLFAVGLTLFFITLVMNGVSRWALGRVRERYR
ncbi:phosphate ABC transporter permease subunit PstC [Gaopeijia maritima]|uniref:Phosphate transport system permease protein n=1 Tax=Gaopeijia maritima TaxID=3119007 RepID=A0ABU9EAL0_9BACT